MALAFSADRLTRPIAALLTDQLGRPDGVDVTIHAADESIRLPRAFGHAQDVSVVTRERTARFESLGFRYHAHGFLDTCRRVSATRLGLAGRAADPTPDGAVRQLEIAVNGRPRACVATRGTRPDVARALGSDRHLASGFACEVEVPEAITPATDVLLVRAVTTGGIETVPHCSAIDEAERFLERQAAVARRPGRWHRWRLAAADHPRESGLRGLVGELPAFLRRRRLGMWDR